MLQGKVWGAGGCRSWVGHPASCCAELSPEGPATPLSCAVPTWGLCLIGDDAADKMGLSGAQVGHQLVKILL